MNRDRAKLIFSMAVFGTIGLVRRFIPYSSGLVALARGAIGALFLLLWRLARREPLPGHALRKNLALLCVSGALIGANWLLLFEAYRYTSVSVATICYYMAPVFVILASPLLFHERLTLKKGLCALAAVGGMALVSGVAEAGLYGIKGVLFGLGAAVLYASVIVINKKIDGLSANDRTLFQLGAATVALLPWTLLTEDFSAFAPNAFALGMLLVAGILHTGVAYALYFGSMRNLPAQTVAILSYIDPVVAVLLSALVLGEELSVSAMVGAALVIGSAIVSETRFGKPAALDAD